MKRGSYAFIREDGSFLIDSTFDTEADAWQVGLGWPSDAEIFNAKQKGARVVWLDVEIPEPTLSPGTRVVVAVVEPVV